MKINTKSNDYFILQIDNVEDSSILRNQKRTLNSTLSLLVYGCKNWLVTEQLTLKIQNLVIADTGTMLQKFAKKLCIGVPKEVVREAILRPRRGDPYKKKSKRKLKCINESLYSSERYRISWWIIQLNK